MADDTGMPPKNALLYGTAGRYHQAGVVTSKPAMSRVQ